MRDTFTFTLTNEEMIQFRFVSIPIPTSYLHNLAVRHNRPHRPNVRLLLKLSCASLTSAGLGGIQKTTTQLPPLSPSSSLEV